MKKTLLLFFVALFLAGHSALFSQLPNWRAQIQITIKNNSGSTMTNYQVPIRVNTQALIAGGYMLANGNDIRFASDCSGSSLYNYWIEGFLNTDSTKLWVRVPTVNPNDSVRIYMYFGNASAPPVSTLSIFNGPNSSTDSVASGSPGGVANSQRGFRFAPTTDILVTHFGKREPTGTQRYVTLFDFGTQAVLRQMQVSGPAGQYSYDALSAPIWLLSGVQYTIQLFQGTGDGYYFGTSSQIGQHLTYFDMKYCNTCTQNTFPTSTLTNYHYGYPDFWYYVKESVTPAPTNVLAPLADTNTPPAPNAVSGTPGNQLAALLWNRSNTNDVWKYLIYRNTSNNPGTSALIDSTVHPDTARTITGLTNGTTYYFWIRAADRFCARRVSVYSNVLTVIPNPVGIINNNEIPIVYSLHQNFPNPFNPTTNIRFDLPKAGFVKLTLYDLTGKVVEQILNEYLAAGYHEEMFNSTNFASGVYFYKLEAGDFVDRKKMVILK